MQSPGKNAYVLQLKRYSRCQKQEKLPAILCDK